MIGRTFFLIIIIIVISLLLFLFIILKTAQRQPINDKIGVTIFPFYQLVKEIVDNKYEVLLIAPPGAEPHNFEPSLADLNKLLGVKIIFSSGTYLDKWSENLIKNFPQAKVVYLNQNIELIDNDPHYWLSLENMKKVAQKINEELINFDPPNKDFYQKNLNKLLQKLDELLDFAKKETLELKSRYLLTQHNAFTYLAKELNLEIIGFLEGTNKEITPYELKNLIDIIKALRVKVIFEEPGEESVVLKNLAKELNLKVYQLDPLEGKSGLNYFEAYKKNIEILKEALSQ